jgi:immune inhibitor A
MNDRRCLVAPHPDLQQKLREGLARLRATADPLLASVLVAKRRKPIGMDDGLILPGDTFPEGTPPRVVRSAAATRAPLRGTLRVIVVLADFGDRPMGQSRQHFEDLFFSTGVLPNGSVKEYFQDVTNGLVEIAGEVVGPYRLPLSLAQYANNDSGTSLAEPNARTMARHAAEAANPAVDFSRYDNDGNGYVDAFIVIHAGPGAEVTGNVGDIWSHKWVLAGSPYAADGARIYAYLTVPEDAKIGVCCHELGHLLFGWPDLYDTDYSSSGLGNWCLMAGGSWNGNGEIPADPSAWCKASQGWVSVVNQAMNSTVRLADVKDERVVYRLWKNGMAGPEYFLAENRQRKRYDRALPSDGLLVYHIDDSIETNSDEAHPKVRLVQADGLRELERGVSRGDAGDPYPGNTKNRAFARNTTPNSRSYGGRDTYVAITNIGDSASTITVNFAVQRVR